MLELEPEPLFVKVGLWALTDLEVSAITGNKDMDSFARTTQRTGPGV